MMATVSALRGPAHRWPHLATSSDSDNAASRVLSAVLAMKGAAAMRFGAPMPAATAAESEETFEAAVALYERRRWDAAYEMLCRLANRGDASASKLALLMMRYGESLYGTRYGARPDLIARWARQVLIAAPAGTALVAGTVEHAA